MALATVVNCRKAKYDVYIGRPSKWGNPFLLDRGELNSGKREDVIARYHRWILDQPGLLNDIHELRGKRLGCYCAPLPCHGDILAGLANDWDRK